MIDGSADGKFGEEMTLPPCLTIPLFSLVEEGIPVAFLKHRSQQFYHLIGQSNIPINDVNRSQA